MGVGDLYVCDVCLILGVQLMKNLLDKFLNYVLFRSCVYIAVTWKFLIKYPMYTESKKLQFSFSQFLCCCLVKSGAKVREGAKWLGYEVGMGEERNGWKLSHLGMIDMECFYCFHSCLPSNLFSTPQSDLKNRLDCVTSVYTL